ncbi:iron complex transport system permease protein [Frankia sp. EI5c]|uniref:FecCD family ABC transporter permease n=1 Tax=Frankia sp. EI5c TaxID=683316 RepID=UPI0007C29EE0|nr:iron chelate uptake ABC transporter family permease subunit [Frankia sp. EI5c]OAA24375.1 iron complex transport system permease protein [Frankia sp. EI5c]
MTRAVTGTAVGGAAVTSAAVTSAVTSAAVGGVPTRGWVVRDRADRLSLRIDGRGLVVCVGLFVAILAAGAVALTTGDFHVPVGAVVDSLLGQGSPGTDFVILDLRLPRLLTGIMVGAALAVSGAIFQTMTANPLGSPDVIGFTAGSSTGAVIVILVLHGNTYETSFGALVGGLVTAVAIYLLSFRRGVAGPRLILVGIGTASMLTAVNSYLITRASLGDAITAQTWLLGSLNRRSWDNVRPLAIALVVLLPTAWFLGRRLSMLAMGSDAARALGVPVERTRLTLLATGAALAACATAAAGPIGFVALAAPQLARHLARSPGAALVPAALLGALVVVVSDLAAQRMFAPSQLPVGVATNAVGGLYLVWLLSRQRRRT